MGLEIYGKKFIQSIKEKKPKHSIKVQNHRGTRNDKV